MSTHETFVLGVALSLVHNAGSRFSAIHLSSMATTQSSEVSESDALDATPGLSAHNAGLCTSVIPPRGDWLWTPGQTLQNWTDQEKFVQSAPKKLKELSGIVSEQVFRAMVYYAYDYPWSSSESRSIANHYLQTHRQDIAFLPMIKSAFVGKHEKVSAAGRRKLQPNPLKFNSISIREADVPWRSDLAVIALFEHYLVAASPSELQQNWSFVVPTVLNIVDDWNAMIKRKGCELVIILLKKVDDTFIKATGLVQVIWDAIEPCLTYLPPGTPVDVSEALLPTTIEALLLVASFDRNRVLMIDRLLRSAIIKGMSQSGQNVRVALVLIKSLARVLDELLIDAVRHLGDLVTIFVGIFVDPFAHSCLPLITQTSATLIVVLKYCWPRIDQYKFELIRAILTAYNRMEAHDPEALYAKRKLKDVYRTLKDIVHIDEGLLIEESSLFIEL